MKDLREFIKEGMKLNEGRSMNQAEALNSGKCNYKLSTDENNQVWLICQKKYLAKIIAQDKDGLFDYVLEDDYAISGDDDIFDVEIGWLDEFYDVSAWNVTNPQGHALTDIQNYLKYRSEEDTGLKHVEYLETLTYKDYMKYVKKYSKFEY